MAGLSRTDVERLYQDALQHAQSGNRAGAIALLTDAYRADARHVGVRNALGVLRLESGDAAGAVALLKPLAKELPNAAPILLNLGNALVAARRADDAIAPLKRATEADPHNTVMWYGYARAVQIAGRAAEAADAYAKVVALEPTHVEALANQSAALMFTNRHEDAEAAALAALQLAPDHAGAHFNRSMALLARGQWKEGWAEYEWREHTPLLDGMRRTWTQPRWNGESVNGRTVLVHAEQGFGDTLQFVRWLAPLRALGAQVILVVPTVLVSLLAAADLADAVLSFSDPMPAHDLQVPLTGLPHRLGLDTDAAVMQSGAPYLRTPTVMDAALAAWCANVPSDRRKVGLVWAGSETHVNDMHRSMRLGVLEPLLRRDDVTWVSLQTGARATDLAHLPRRVRVHDASPWLTTFAHTAQLLLQLDAVITVDSAVAHLAGALGRRCWLMLPQVGRDWRWAAEQAEQRWYHSVEPVRQTTAGDWRQAVVALEAQLGTLATAAPER
jgi:Tetratricopeptide repeat